MKHIPYYEVQHPNWKCVAKRYRFKNGYGASVIKAEGSYGYNKNLWELAVLKFTDDTEDGDFEIDYTTPITNDVLENLTDQDVEDNLTLIKNLPTFSL